MATWIESIDVNNYVQNLFNSAVSHLNAATQKQLDQLSTNETPLTAKISTYGQLQSMYNTLQQDVSNLTTKFNPNFSITSSNTSVATVTASGTAAPGNHSLTVTKLAQSEQVASTNAYGSQTSALNMSNTLTVTVGSSNFGVTINTSDSLQSIANNINSAAAANNVGAFASIISTGAQYQLVISSTQTGTANAVSISETGVGANALAITTGGGGTGTILSVAQNAQFTLDTINYNLASNNNTITGMNISLLNTGNTTLSVTQTNAVSDVAQALQTTLTDYNNMMIFIAKQQASTTLPDGVLSTIQSTLQNLMSNNSTLVSYGIAPTPNDQIQTISVTTPDGKSIAVHPSGLLSIQSDPVTNANTLTTMLTNSFSTAQSSLVGTSGIFTQLNNLFSSPSPSATSGGSLWQALNDVNFGAIKITNTQISSINQQKTTIQSNENNQIEVLKKQYAQFDLLLSKMQVQSQYMSQQLAVMNQKG